MTRSGRRLYRLLLRALPARFRAEHGREMEDLLAESLDACRRRGRAAWAAGWAAAVADVASRAVRLRLARLTAPSSRRDIVETLRQDLRWAVRSLARSPGYAALAVVTLAVGVGATAAIFGLVDAVLLRPPAHVEDPDELVAVYTSDFSGPRYGMSSYRDFLDFRDVPALEGATLVTPALVNLAGEDGIARTLLGEYVSAGYFDVLGVRLLRGRGFTPEEDRPEGGEAVAVLGYGLWQRELGGDPGVVGRTLRLSGRSVTVVGIAPEGFRGSLPVVTSDLFLPVSTQALVQGPEAFERRGHRGSMIRGRLAEGAGPAAVREQLAAVADRLRASDPGSWTDVRDRTRRVTVEADTRLPPQVRGAATGFAALLLAVVGVVLLIACANVANLTLARASARTREMAVRVSVGAGRGRVVRQLLTESALVGLAGGAAGLALAEAVLGLADALPPVAGVALTVDVGVDGRVLALAVAVTALTVAATGLLPALRASRPDLVSSLKEGPEGAGRGGGLRLRSLLVVAQVSASLVLLVGAGLFLRSVRAAISVDPGFEVEDVATVTLNLAPEGYGPEASLEFFDRLRSRVEAHPAVTDAAVTDALPMTPNASRRGGLRIEGYEPAEGEDMEFQFFAVGPGLVSTLGMPLVAGRDIAASDDADAPRVVLVNASLAARYWPGADPLGRTVSWDGGATQATVVGVVRDAMYRNLRDEDRPAYFMPLAQSPPAFLAYLTLAARTRPGRTGEVLEAMRTEVRAADPGLTGITSLQTLEEAVAFTLLPQRAASWLLSLAGGVGLLLAAVGLYGVMSFLVAQRTREMGVRLALGARRAQVVRMVVGRGLRLAAAGAVVGLAAAAAVTRFLGSLLFGVSPLDPAVFVGMAAAALAVAALASWVPARRAARVEPARTLRVD